MILGFTGTQAGMTWSQGKAVAGLFRELRPDEVHHGDCIGADEQFHNLVLRCRFVFRVVVQPAASSEKRAFCKGPRDVVMVKFGNTKLS